MPTLNELLEQGVKDGLAIADDAARDAAVEALKKHLPPVYLAINNLAFGAGLAKKEKEATDAETAKTAAEARAKKAEEDLLAERGKTPDIKKINDEWGVREDNLKDAHKKEKQKLVDRIRKGWVERDQEALQALLVSEHHVPKYTAKVLARDTELIPARGDYDDNGTLSVRQAGQQIPLAPGSGQTHLSMLAAEIAATVPQDERRSNGDSGSGVSGGAAPGGGDKAFFAKIAEDAKKDQEGAKPRVSLQERVKNR